MMVNQPNEPGAASTRQADREGFGASNRPAGSLDPERAPDTRSPEGNEFSSSDAPIGEGSNTPTGNEPSGFQSWDARQPEPSRERFGTDTDSWGATATDRAGQALPVGAGLAAAAGIVWALFSWWQSRRARQTRAAKMRQTLMGYATTYGAGVPKRVGAAAGKAKSPWLPFALLPAALYLKSQGRKGERAGKDLLEPLELEDRGKELARQAAERVEKASKRWIRDSKPAELVKGNGGSGWLPWLALVPVGGAAYYVFKQMKTSGGLFSGGGFFKSEGAPSGEASTRTVRDVMSRNVEVIAPDAPVAEAARKMRDLNVGSLPVCDGQRLIGVITDRDVTIRATAEGKGPDGTTVRQAMSPEVSWVFEDEPANLAATIMRQRQIRRLPVLDRSDKLVGIISLGDLATEVGDDNLSGQTLEDISRPNR